MTDPGHQVRANMLLCDAAQVVGDKLYILGGGWSYVWLGDDNATVSIAAAIDLVVPWEFTNRDLKVVLRIITEDGEDVIAEDGESPLLLDGKLVVGRAPQARPGADIHVPLVLAFAPTRLEPGGYVAELLVNTDSVAKAGFQVNRLGQ